MDNFDKRLVEIDLAQHREFLRWCFPEHYPDDENEEISEDNNDFLPPEPEDNPMLPGVMGEIVYACCEGMETSPVATGATLLAMFGASLGRTRYVDIGDYRRWLNPWFLLSGRTGCGKGASEESPRRIMRHAENHLFDACERARDAGQCTDNWSPLAIHTGGLSSGEGLAWMLRDKDGDTEGVTDKRLLVIEDEMANVFDQGLRSGNTLSNQLRSVYNGRDLKPATRHNRVEASDPHVALVGHMTPKELVGHETTRRNIHNGLLNRFIPIAIPTPKRVLIPPPIDERMLARFGEDLAARIIRARGSFETHWRKQAEQAQPVTFSDACITWWEKRYLQYTGDDDCVDLGELVARHRSHVFVLSALFALLDARDVIEPQDMFAACRWMDYCRGSLVRIFGLNNRQRHASFLHDRARVILTGIATHGRATRTSMYRWLGNKTKKEDMDDVLRWLADHNPPLLRYMHRSELPENIRDQSGRPGRPTVWYGLTDWAWKRYFGGKYVLTHHD